MSQLKATVTNSLPNASLSLRLALSIGLLLAACSSVIDARVDSLWKHHEQAVQRAIEANQKGDEFGDARLFFEVVAGITVRANIFTLGHAPVPETRADLELVRAWYKTNRRRLYWDEKSRTVKLRGSVESQKDLAPANGP
jgi:hypothetical protein